MRSRGYIPRTRQCVPYAPMGDIPADRASLCRNVQNFENLWCNKMTSIFNLVADTISRRGPCCHRTGHKVAAGIRHAVWVPAKDTSLSRAVTLR